VVIDWSYAGRILPDLLRGLVVTIEATVLGMAIALVLGLAWALLRRSSLRVVPTVCDRFVDFVRSTPLLIQLFFFYYAMPEIGVSLPPLATGVLVLGLHTSSYTAEIYRSGLEGVPRGQWEAAAALGLGPRTSLLRVILPQAVARIVPALGNRFIALFKDTPLLSAITVLEVLQRARIVGAESFRYLEPFTEVGLLFLALSLVSAWGVQRLETRLQPRH
jgi:polar amino acid transport system permease protein